MQVTVTPKYVNPPKEGKKNGSIKDEGDVFYSVPPDMLASFHVGQPVTFDYVMKNYGGKDINFVERVYLTAGPAPVIRELPPNSGPPINTRNGDGRSEDIFVAGVVNNAIAYQSHPLDVKSLARLVKAARSAYRNGEPKANDDLDDVIPF